MLEITPTLQIPDTEFTWTFARSSGPGGQNVNKVASKAILRWNLAANRSLPAEVKGRFAHQQRGRIGTDEEGEAVALEPAPLVLAGPELVVVVDHGRRLDPERAAAQPQPQREVDVLVVEE